MTMGPETTLFGQPGYYGPTRDVGQYLGQLGLHMAQDYNPADFLREGTSLVTLVTASTALLTSPTTILDT